MINSRSKGGNGHPFAEGDERKEEATDRPLMLFHVRITKL